MVLFLSIVGAVAVAIAAVYLGIAAVETVLAMAASDCSLDEITIVITGCDSGIGRALSIHLMSKGVRVLAGCLTERGVASLNEIDAGKYSVNNGEVGKVGKIHAFLMDVTSDISVKEACDFAKKTIGGGRLHAVINNAGVIGGSFVEFVPIETLQKTMDINFLGVARVCKQFLPLLAQSSGRIINLVTPAALVHLPCMSDYAASKCAVMAFGNCLRREVSAQGVKVIQLYPGLMNTDMVHGIYTRAVNMFDKATPDVKKRYGLGALQFSKGSNQTVGKLCGRIEQIFPSVENALVSMFPRASYYIGWDTLFIWRPLSFMPSVLVDIMNNFVPSG